MPPIYQYKCQKCEEVSEVIQGINEPPLDKCEECGHPEPQRIISRTTFHLKGSGWFNSGGY